MSVQQILSTQLKGLFKTVMLHSSVGAFFGYALLHPIAVAIYYLTIPEQAQALTIESLFDRQHVWMAACFALIGMVFGSIHGLYRHRNRQLFQNSSSCL